MPDTRCPTCGKAPACFSFLESDRVVELPSCDCAKQPEPTLTALFAEIKACRAEIGAIRAEQAAINARASSLALLQTGEYVVPTWAGVARSDATATGESPALRPAGSPPEGSPPNAAPAP